MTALKTSNYGSGASATLNDISIGADGDYEFLSDVEAYGEIIASAVKTVMGEIQLNTSAGIDYKGTIWNNRSLLQNWASLVESLIRSYDFVRSISSFTYDISKDGVLSYKIKINTKSGETTVES